MLAIVLSVVLYLAVLLLMVGSGFLTEMAAMDWLLVSGVALVAFLAAVAFYRGSLRGWVHRRNHPLSLRILSGLFGMYVWIVVVMILFRTRAAESLAWDGDPRSGMIAILLTLAVGAVFLGLGYARRRRIA